MSKKTRIFLVDDDPMFLKSLENEFLQTKTFEVKTFPTGEEAMKHIGEKPDVVFLDYYLNSVDTKAMNGLMTLKKIKVTDPSIPVVMLTSQDRVEVAVNCMKNEAFDYIVKSEAAYMRANNAIKNIFRYRDLVKEARFYKRAGLISFACITIIIVTLFVISMFFPNVVRRFFANPGWVY